MRTGITFKGATGLGDKIQFTSIPENFYNHYGHKIIDVDRSFVFDHNPFVSRDEEPETIIDAWNSDLVVYAPDTRSIATSNAEIHSSDFGWYPVIMNRPRLYIYENYPYKDRSRILLQVRGRAQGQMPEHVVKHVLNKYGKENVSLVGHPGEWAYEFEPPEHIHTPTFWDLAKVVSESKMVIGLDSGISWVASCYPDVIVKKLRSIQPAIHELKNFIPLQFCNQQSHWDDRAHMVYNPTENDLGYTWSYKRI